MFSFQRRRCPQLLHATDGLLNQRAYVCHACAMQFKLGPFTMAKSSCLICTNMIVGGMSSKDMTFKKEARFCQKHGSRGYPSMIHCVLCQRPQHRQIGSTASMADPVPLNICLQCWIDGKALPRCCALETQ